MFSPSSPVLIMLIIETLPIVEICGSALRICDKEIKDWRFAVAVSLTAVVLESSTVVELDDKDKSKFAVASTAVELEAPPTMVALESAMDVDAIAVSLAAVALESFPVVELDDEDKNKFAVASTAVEFWRLHQRWWRWSPPYGCVDRRDLRP